MTIGLSALLRHELRILRNSTRAVFARKRDWVPLVIGLPLLLAGLVQALRGFSADTQDALWLVAMAVGVASFAGQTAILRRLDRLAGGSVMAKAALQPRVALTYGACAHLASAALCCAAVAIVAVDWRAPGVGLLSYGSGLLAATLLHRLSAFLRGLRWRPQPLQVARRMRTTGSLRLRLAELLIRRVGFARLSIGGNVAACFVLGAGVGLLYLLLRSVAPDLVAEAVSGAIMLVALALLARQHPPLWRYLLVLGVRPAALALLPVLPAAALLAGFVAVAAAGGGVRPGALAAGAAMVLLLFALFGMLRALHYATKNRAHADFAIQVELIAVGITGLLAIFLVPVILLGRLLMLRQTAERSRWLLP
jgi:hypothetical protein